MEKFPQATDPERSPIESKANFEGNDGELLIERFNDPIIKNQIIDLLHKNELIEEEKIRNRTYTPYSSTDMPNSTCFKDEEGTIYISDDPDYNPRNYTARTRTEIEQEYNETLEKISTQTDIDFSTNEPNESCIPLNWKMPWNEEKPTAKQMSIIVAHEKGHAIRRYQDLKDYFIKGFDPTKIEYTEKDFEIDIVLNKKEGEEENLDIEKMKLKSMKYLFSGPEIAERMSQLKNYFGITGAESFTKEHLHYAREHYIPDTGMDNRMRHFFQAITPETEDAFIELINTSGI